jgi:hypothetical protein
LRVVESAGGSRMDHRAGGYSDRAVALAMALELAQRRGKGRGMTSSVPRGRLPGIAGGRDPIAALAGRHAGIQVERPPTYRAPATPPVQRRQS